MERFSFRMRPDLIACTVLFLSLGGALCQEKKPQACSVQITAPKPDQRVGADVAVEGSAVLPSGGAQLWVFAHRKGLALWWPQGGGAAEIDKKGQWTVLTTFGQDQDRGFSFEILAVVLSAEESAKLNAWFVRSEQTGTYNGMRLPPFVTSCGPGERITVMRTN
jgi:hypothetical protein